jgi:hypothetical protein
MNQQTVAIGLWILCHILALETDMEKGVCVNPRMRTTSSCVTGSPYANFLAIPARLHTGIGDPRMHTAIPVCKITHMGVQDLISHMEIFPTVSD